MQKKLIVTSTERNSGKRSTLFQGIGDVCSKNDDVEISYLEKDQLAKVTFLASLSEGHLRRVGEAETKLVFNPNQTKTLGLVTNELGCIEMMIQTHTYIRTPNVIAIEYDVMNEDEVIEAYRLVWKIKDLHA